ncbi:MAG TPA: HD domain-containing phosphohydrolase [Blastocatellia bacterium]|nr:HD domain-containing phosphohydrolase [Blastocatellia bacterium]
MELRKPVIDMSDYNRAARLYWLAATSVGALALCWSIVVVLCAANNLLGIASLMAVVFLAGLRPIRIPGTITSITPGDIFIFLSALMWGPPAAVLVAATDAFAGSYRTSRRWTSRIGSPALMTISILISAECFSFGDRWLKEHRLDSTATLIGTLLLFSLAHFLLNSLLTSGLYALKQQKRLISLWWSNYCWASLTSLASASAAGLVYLSITQYGLSALLAAAPLVAIVFATSHYYFKQADERAKASERISEVHLATVEALATAINAKDEITHDHVYRVRVYATGLARHFGLGEPEIEALRAGALLHDVGKIAVPDYILNKPGKLSAAEFEKMKIHTVVGAQIMERVNFPYPVVPIVRHHHERWDGRGYPDGKAGDQIPLTARILTVVDCFDAVREDRQYRKGMTRDQACAFLSENAGTQFDPAVVRAFLENLSVYEREIAEHKAAAQPAFAAGRQAGLSESAAHAVPAAGLEQAASDPPEYIKQIHAAHVEVASLYEMAQHLSARLEVSDVIALTVSRIERMLPFTDCVFYMRRERDDSAFAAFAFGKNAESIKGRSLGAGRGIAGWVIINGRPMCNTDAMLDLNEFLGDPECASRTAAVYPLTNGDKTIGALALYSAEVEAYSSAQLHLLESVSRLASTALQHAMLFEQTKANTSCDGLTGLPTGPALYARFDQQLGEAKGRNEPVVVLCLGLEGLRAVNESYGYQAGDRVLTEAAGVLRNLVGDTGLLGRVAGDEFICVLRNCEPGEAAKLGEILRNEIDCLSVEARPEEYARVRLRYSVQECKEGQTVDDLLHAIAVAARKGRTTQKLHSAGVEPTESRMVS